MNTLNLDPETKEMLQKIMQVKNCSEEEAIMMSVKHTISLDVSLK